MQYNIIIVGASIAGISSAIHLKKLNKDIKILIIDKCKFPRNKLCAGYLTTKSVNLLQKLGINISKIDYKLVKGIRIFYKGKVRMSADNHGLYCHKLVDRTALDYELFKTLSKYNIDILENTKINELDESSSSITINEDKYYYDSLIFADGELGYSTKFNLEKKKYIALQVNFKNKIKPKIDMYFGIVKKGYAWCASSGSYTNIGFCDIYNKDINYKEIFNNYLISLGFENIIKENKVKGFFVPYGLKKNKIINDNVYLIGDAVGTVDPLTLAGVSYAIKSGENVALSIVNKDNKIYLKYLNKINFKFKILKLMTNILYLPITLFIFLRVGGHFFGKPFSYILDKFILSKNGSFHE